MNWLLFIISSLASFRLALMFSKEKGPGDIFQAIRLSTNPLGKLRAGIECILCESVWWAGVITVYLCLTKRLEWQMSPIYWLATSAAACIVHFQWGKEEPECKSSS